MSALMGALSVVNYAAAGFVVLAAIAGAVWLSWVVLAPEAPVQAPEREYRSIEDCVPSRQSWR